MNIALDIDGILANADFAFRSMMRHLFKRPFAKNKVKSFHYEDSFELSESEMKKFYKMFHNEELWLTMKPLKGAVESVKKLSEDNRIVIVTARPRDVKQATIKWLKENEINYQEIYFTLADKHLLLENYNEKIDVFLEDHPIYIQRISDAGTKVIMFEYPWNNHLESRTNIYRVKNWNEAMVKISDLYSEIC
ncbi:MAG: hypothetical protein P9M01_01190 [Candidatus Kappaea frigidicola]|nr:hypothetical protein [Candidatus Kappaea frigidicola]